MAAGLEAREKPLHKHQLVSSTAPVAITGNGRMANHGITTIGRLVSLITGVEKKTG